jgi:uncharacterized membrane protein YgcG
LRVRLALLVLSILAVVALAAPAAAPAADTDVIVAWGSEDKALDAAGTSLNAGLKRAEKSKFRRVGSIVTTLKKMESLTLRVRKRVAGEAPSTRSGIAARGKVLASLDGFAKSLKSLRLAVSSAGRGRVLAARRYLRRSKSQADAASTAAREAITLFQQGQRESQPAPPPSQPPPPSDGTQQPPPPPSDGTQQPPPSDGTQQQPPPSDGTQQPPPSDGGGSGGDGSGGGGGGDGGGGDGGGGDDGGGEPGPGPIDFPDIPLP